MSITIFFSVTYVKCGLCQINENNSTRTASSPKMFWDQTEAMSDRSDPGPQPGPVLTLVVMTTVVIYTVCYNMKLTALV